MKEIGVSVFSWKNVPKVLVVMAVIATIVMVWSFADSSLYGGQVLMIPVFIVAAAALWLFVYLSGLKKEEITADEQLRAAEQPAAPAPEVVPDFQDYMPMEEWMEKHPDAEPPALPPEKGSHTYDARV